MDRLTDNELMKSICVRDNLALKELYQRYHLPIFNFILRLTGSRELAQDILQEVFTRVWFAAHTFHFKNGNCKGWIYKIALNITRNEMSRKRYQYHYHEIQDLKGTKDEPIDSEMEQPDKQFENIDQHHFIFEALEKLNPHLREIIIFKHFNQLTFREIAEITDTPEGTLKARFHRAIEQLQVLLEPLDL